MTSPEAAVRSFSPPGGPLSPIPDGLRLPEINITRRTRTQSMNGRIGDEIHEGSVKFFCRSRGHGFIDDDIDSYPVFMHISDIEGEYIPRKGDKVLYNVCPMPPRFDKPQAVHIKIIDFTPEMHHRWTDKETPEELAEDAKAIKEEQEMNDRLKQTPPHRRISGPCHTVQESPDEGPPTCNDV